MAHPLINIESRGSVRPDGDDIRMNHILTEPSRSDAQTTAVQKDLFQANTKPAYNSDTDDRVLTASSQRTSSSLTATETAGVERTTDAAAKDPNDMPVWQLVNVVLSVAGISFLSSFSTGLITIGIPQTAADVGLSDDLLLWYVPIFGGPLLKYVNYD